MTKRDRVLFVYLRIFTVGVILVALGPPPVQGTFAASSYTPTELSYGLYWFGLNGAHQKFAPGEANPYFDPDKPTLIFVHGWQPSLSYTLPDFDFNGTDTAAGWIDAGWNVGIFVWNQFSDETTGVSSSWFDDGPPPQGVLDAEAKIWTANGPRGMRWRDWDDWFDGYSDPPPGTPSAGMLFYQTYVAALTDQPYADGDIRIAGHSLGNQMAVRLVKLVDEGIAAGNVPENLRPSRVALLDPYWSPGSQDYLENCTTGDVVREYVAGLTSTGTLFEWYWSSAWTTPPQGDANDLLKPMTFYAEMDPAYALQDTEKHLAAQHLYFWSYAFDGPAPCTGEDCLGMTRVLSKMSNDQLAAVMRSDYRWAQTAGQNTDTPGDDAYHAVLQSGAPYTVTALTAHPVSQTVGGAVIVTATVPAAPEGTLVSFATDLGTITPRAVLRGVPGGLASASLTSNLAGTAHVSATTRGVGGTVQSTTTVTFTIDDVNDAPYFTSTPVTVATSGLPYTYLITADDPDLIHGDTLSITALTLPAWLALTGSGDTATLAGTPTHTALGDHPVVLTVSDAGGLTDTQSFTITVAVGCRIYVPLVLSSTPD